MLARVLRGASATPSAWPDRRIAPVWDQFDQGTQRAILRLLRDTDGRWVSARADALGALSLQALILYGERDPWIAPGVAESYATLMPGAESRTLPDAGHWPWLDDPGVIDTLARFLDRPQ
jgi:pimeloyl-ACP methyl ester carboxylesterase